ncbi:MAG: hypothetical protein ABI706_16935 [Ilumatobacteraceae bacterium]
MAIRTVTVVPSESGTEAFAASAADLDQIVERFADSVRGALVEVGRS